MDRLMRSCPDVMEDFFHVLVRQRKLDLRSRVRVSHLHFLPPRVRVDRYSSRDGHGDGGVTLVGRVCGVIRLEHLLDAADGGGLVEVLALVLHLHLVPREERALEVSALPVFPAPQEALNLKGSRLPRVDGVNSMPLHVDAVVHRAGEVSLPVGFSVMRPRGLLELYPHPLTCQQASPRSPVTPPPQSLVRFPPFAFPSYLVRTLLGRRSARSLCACPARPRAARHR
eukprot:763598-Hanusia_phi.AAC.4